MFDDKVFEKTEKVMAIFMSVGIGLLVFMLVSSMLFDGGQLWRESKKDKYDFLGFVNMLKPENAAFEEKFGKKVIVIDDNGYALVYQGNDIYLYKGGGCVDGIIPVNYEASSIDSDSLLFFGKRSLSSFTEMECYLVFNKLVMDMNTEPYLRNTKIQEDIGVFLIYSSKAGLGNELSKRGYDTESIKIISSIVGRKPLEEDNHFGDLYGWYIIEVSDKEEKVCQLEGFAILHSREYGFSAENYICFN